MIGKCRVIPTTKNRATVIFRKSIWRPILGEKVAMVGTRKSKSANSYSRIFLFSVSVMLPVVISIKPFFPLQTIQPFDQGAIFVFHSG